MSLSLQEARFTKAGNRFLQVLIQEMGFILDIEFLLELLNLIELKQDKASDVRFMKEVSMN